MTCWGAGARQCAAACVQALQAAGIGTVVAPGLVADLAEETGIASVLLYLENWVERMLACQGYVCDAPGAVDTARLLEVFPECAGPLPLAVPAAALMQLKETRHHAQQQREREVLESVHGNQRQACEILGISRATLWRRMKGECRVVWLRSDGVAGRPSQSMGRSVCVSQHPGHRQAVVGCLPRADN